MERSPLDGPGWLRQHAGAPGDQHRPMIMTMARHSDNAEREAATAAAAAADEDFEYTIRPIVPGDSAEQAHVQQMYLDNYDAYSSHACGKPGCVCAELGAGMKRYTQKFATDMTDITGSHIDTGGQFWVVIATPRGAAAAAAAGGGGNEGGAASREYAGCVGGMRHSSQLAELHRLSVSPAHRRRSLARRLVATVESWSREQGFDALFLTTWPPRGCPGTAASSDLYSKLGFDIVAPGSTPEERKAGQNKGPRVFVKAVQAGVLSAALTPELRDPAELQRMAHFVFTPKNAQETSASAAAASKV
eukprot:COSAG05_NODE_24_length_31553_cov_12.138647_14_plen_304_part_00